MKDYIHKTQSEKFLLSVYRDNKPSIVGSICSLGVLCNLPILKAEYYVCDAEPVINKIKGARIIIWSRSEGAERPKGWLQMFGNVRYTALAVVDLKSVGVKYFESWSGSAKTSRSKWLAQRKYKLTVTDMETYIVHYGHSTVSEKLRNVFTKQIRDYKSVYDKDINFYIVTDSTTNAVVSGLCTVDDHETNQSLHLSAFRSSRDVDREVGVGLIDHWMTSLVAKDIRYANLGVVWQKGDPKSWLGYSSFKMHFRPNILKFEKPLFKLTFN